jgi:hypothetical protein
MFPQFPLLCIENPKKYPFRQFYDKIVISKLSKIMHPPLIKFIEKIDNN